MPHSDPRVTRFIIQTFFATAHICQPSSRSKSLQNTPLHKEALHIAPTQSPETCAVHGFPIWINHIVSFSVLIDFELEYVFFKERGNLERCQQTLQTILGVSIGYRAPFHRLTIMSNQLIHSTKIPVARVIHHPK